VGEVALVDAWPDVLAGPWLRRVDTTHVSVFLAFKEERTVTVTVKVHGSNTVVATSNPTDTVAIGQHLHVVLATAVTAGAALTPNIVYEYDVSWTRGTGSTDLQSAGLLTGANSVAYPSIGLPSFSLPPSQLKDVNLVHGSCRKAHSEGIDMLPTLDTLIATDAADPVKRPHQLFLTGDQIYADDVASAMLSACTAVGEALLGWSETLPGLTAPHNHPTDLLPGKRADVVTATGGAGAGITTDHDVAASHLIGLGEFYAMYVLSFSPAAWPAIPTFAQAFPQESADYEAAQADLAKWRADVDRTGAPAPFVPNVKLKADYDAQTARVSAFTALLPAVRRALANVPSYTICDDHEVSDDWYMNRTWCTRVLGQPLGRRLLRNALLSYALFQAWGNTPDRFDTLNPGATLLSAAASAVAPSGFPATSDATFESLFNMPAAGADPSPAGGMSHSAHTMDWHYRVAIDGAPFEVLVFDSRTWRAFPAGVVDPPELIGSAGFTAQMASFGDLPASTPIKVTIAVVPGPIFDLPYMSELKRGETWQPHGFATKLKDGFELDYEAWDGQPIAQQRLLGNLFARSSKLIALAGDVHFSFAARMTMWATKLFGQTPDKAATGVLAQFTCSPLCNEDHSTFGSYQFTTGGFDRAVTDHGTVPQMIDVVGWNRTIGTAIKIGQHKEGVLFWRTYRPWYLRQEPSILKVNDIPSDSVMVAEDFRYQVSYLEIDGGLAARRSVVTATPVAQNGSAADGLKNAQKLLRDGGGLQVVGANSIGRIRFAQAADGTAQSATQELLWRVPGVADAQVYSAWTVSLTADPPPPKLPGVP
jgi:hypothetical protein